MTQNLVCQPEELVVPQPTDAGRQSNVVGGTPEPDYRFPWVVGVGGTLDGKGVLIAPTWVLTAAHNVETVRAATVSYRRMDPTGRTTEGTRQSSAIVMHPNYVGGRPDHDLALIQLRAPFPQDPYLQPATLPVAPATRGQLGIVANFPHNGSLPAGHLAVLRGAITLEGKTSFEGRSPTASICPGDSGSGFIDATGNGQTVVVGIVALSRVQDCTKVNLPFECTDVFQHLDWILRTSRIHVLDRSGELRTPAAAGVPTVCVIPGLGHTNIAYRESSGPLHELWRDARDATGTTRLSAIAPDRPKAAGHPFAYVDTARNTEILLFRDRKGVVRSLHWSTGAVGHDNLSGGARAPAAAGDPVGYYAVRSDEHHVCYRTSDGHLHELWWAGVTPVRYGGNVTGAIGAPPAAGTPSAYVDTHGTNVVVYRGTDGHIRSIFWKGNGPSGLDDLSGVAGMPLAAGDPVAYYTARADLHQIVYRGVDNRLYELHWQGVAAVAGWDLTTPAGAPLAVGTAAAYYSAGTNTKHVIYRSQDKHLHDLSWRPGSSMPLWTDLTVQNARRWRPIAPWPSPSKDSTRSMSSIEVQTTTCTNYAGRRRPSDTTPHHRRIRASFRGSWTAGLHTGASTLSGPRRFRSCASFIRPSSGTATGCRTPSSVRETTQTQKAMWACREDLARPSCLLSSCIRYPLTGHTLTSN